MHSLQHNTSRIQHRMACSISKRPSSFLKSFMLYKALENKALNLNSKLGSVEQRSCDDVVLKVFTRGCYASYPI